MKTRASVGPVTVALDSGSAVPLLIAPVNVNGQGPFSFVVDSGTGRTVVSGELAGRLAIASDRADELTSAHGRVSVNVGTARRIDVGGLGVDGCEVTIADLAPFRAVGLDIDGLLGVDVLRGYAVRLDCARSTLTLSEDDHLEPSDAFPVTLAPNKPLALLPVTVNGGGPYRFGLDSGALASVVSVDVANREQIGQRQAATALGAGGSFSVETALATLGAGELERRDLSVGIAAMGELSSAVGTPLDGLLGLDFLADVILTLDYRAGLARLEGPTG